MPVPISASIVSREGVWGKVLFSLFLLKVDDLSSSSQIFFLTPWETPRAHGLMLLGEREDSLVMKMLITGLGHMPAPWAAPLMSVRGMMVGLAVELQAGPWLTPDGPHPAEVQPHLSFCLPLQYVG